MSDMSGRRRTADCDIRWCTATLDADRQIVRIVPRRAAGAMKRALAEYRDTSRPSV